MGRCVAGQGLMLLMSSLIDDQRAKSRQAEARPDNARKAKQHAPRNSLSHHDHTSARQRLAMAVLSFSLTPEATGQIYEALVCLAKFGESVAIEARGDKVRMCQTMNSSSHTDTDRHVISLP